MSLPLCDLTEIPRLLCAHCESFTMTDDERLYLAGWEVYAPATSTPGKPLPSTDYEARSYGIPGEVKAANTDLKCNVGCGRTRDESVFVCAQCIENLEVALGDVPALLDDLLIVTMKQARFTTSGKGSDRSPLPFSPQAADTAAHLSNEIVTAVRMLCEHRGIPQPALLNAKAGSRWLLKNVHAVAVDEGGPDMVTGILREHRRAMRAIDCPPDRTYIGLCDGCKAPMHARADEPEFRCRDCGAEYVVTEKVENMKGKIRGALLTTGQLEKVIASKFESLKVSRHRINRLVAQRRLISRGHNRDGDALYLADDLLVILEAEAEESPA